MHSDRLTAFCVMAHLLDVDSNKPPDDSNGDEPYHELDDGSGVEKEGTPAISEMVHSAEEQAVAVEAFKTAVTAHNEAEVVRIAEEFAALELMASPIENGRSALHLAVEQSDYQMMSALLEHGASVSFQIKANPFCVGA